MAITYTWSMCLLTHLSLFRDLNEKELDSELFWFTLPRAPALRHRLGGSPSQSVQRPSLTPLPPSLLLSLPPSLPLSLPSRLQGVKGGPAAAYTAFVAVRPSFLYPRGSEGGFKI